MLPVAIVGAGPYGLSLSAHLTALGTPHAIFGPPMGSWQSNMPAGMLLKSEGFATDLYAPAPGFPLREYCRQHNLPYADVGLPVPRSRFVDYGIEFQRRFVPHLDTSLITAIRPLPGGAGFQLETASGQLHQARRVVLAVGHTLFAHFPPELADAPAPLISHSFQHADVSSFRGKSVLVLGAGSSAVDLAIEFANADAQPHLLARAGHLAFHPPPQEPRPLKQRILYPRVSIGVGWRSKLAADLPLVFHAMPQRLRHRAVARHLGPAPGWFARAQFEGRVTTHLGATLLGVTPQPPAQPDNLPQQLLVRFRDASGTEQQIVVDHIVAATGYKPRLDRFTFLDPTLLGGIQTEGASPCVDRNFQTSVPGLYMVGLATANSFGPLVRFACGAEFTVKRLAPHLARKR